MALSQVQCLDDNHVNPRTHESKAEFFYSEDQRLALETLLRDGRDTFFKYLEARGLRGFLSDPELEALSAAAETYEPGKDLYPETHGGAGGGGSDGGEPTPLSQHYWPDLSDTSIPEMDLGWPDADGYRGVTRTAVYTQPPLDGQAHVKEVVRKMIAQAQKVIGVVMDVFTDVDIFRDLIDVGFKKKVSVYILLERLNLPHFLAMCRRANMHSGHLKHLRVRCTDGAEFHTRSCTKVRGRMGHRFMFVDGDKAVSGSYSFTWMSSRLDRNLITVTTGQAVDGFDRLFRYLYANSDAVDLRQVVMEPEPEPEVAPQPVAVVMPSAAVARKMYNPKYALVAAASNPSPTASVGRESPKEPDASENPKKKRRRRQSEEEGPPIHPGLVNLEKAYLIPYLPTWPEPDPPSDVIGFINIRDANKPAQVHLQRSEMFETSQAIRFSSPFSRPTEPLPDVAKPQHLTAKPQEMSRPQPETQKTTSAGNIDHLLPAHLRGSYKLKTQEQILNTSVLKTQDFNKNKIFNTDSKPYGTNAAANKVETPFISPYASFISSSRTPISSKETTSHIAEPPSRMSYSLRDSEPTKEADRGSFAVYRPHTLDSNGTQAVQLPAFSGSKTKDEHAVASRTNSYSGSASSAAAGSPFISQKSPTPMSSLRSNASDGASVFSSGATSPISLTTQNSSRSPSATSSLTSPLPVPKPRTVQLLINDDSSDSQVRLVKKAEASAEPAKQTAVPSSPARTPTLGELSRTAKETAPPKESVASKETKGKEADGRLDVKSPSQSKDYRSTIFTSSHSQDVSPQTNFQEPFSKSRGNVQTPDRTLHLQLTGGGGGGGGDARVAGLSTPSPDRESRSILSLVRAPTPDRISPRLAGFRTPSSDVSDGYVSSRDDSNLSTTSDEYYECNDSPFHEPVFEQVFRSRGETPMFAKRDGGSSSSVIDKRVKARQAEDEDDGKGKARKLSLVGRAEWESREADGAAEQLGKHRNSIEVHSPTKKGISSQSATGEWTAEAAASRTRPPGGDLKASRVASEAERPAKAPSGSEKVSNLEVERREAEERKKAQQNDAVSPSSRPPRPPRPATGNHYGGRPFGNRPLNQTESKVLEVLESRKSPSRPPAPATTTTTTAAGSAGGASRQGRTRSVGQSPTSQQKPPLSPHAESQAAAAAAGQDEGKSPFSITLSKLYNLRGLKMNKTPPATAGRSNRSASESRKSSR
ncbi:unnamed protein product [Ophioblennius macclurei]